MPAETPRGCSEGGWRWLPCFSSAPPTRWDLLCCRWRGAAAEGVNVRGLRGGACEWDIKGLTPPAALALSGGRKGGIPAWSGGRKP